MMKTMTSWMRFVKWTPLGSSDVEDAFISGQRLPYTHGKLGMGDAEQPHAGNTGKPDGRRPRADAQDRAPAIGQRGGGQENEEVDEAFEPVLEGGRPGLGGQRVRHGQYHRQQQEIGGNQRQFPARLADACRPQLRDPDQHEQQQQGFVVENLPARVDEHQQHRHHGERGDARPWWRCAGPPSSRLRGPAPDAGCAAPGVHRPAASTMAGATACASSASPRPGVAVPAWIAALPISTRASARPTFPRRTLAA